MAQTPAAKRSLGQRLTGKVGPLPAWAWAALILVVYFAYTKLRPASSSSTTADTSGSSTGTSDSTPVTGDTSGNPPSSGQGSSADNLSDSTLSQLSGFQASIDSLTAAVQSSSAFSGTTGDSGSSDYSGGSVNLPNLPSTTAPAPAPTIAKPAAKPAATRYYTYAPGKAPKGQAANQAPAKVAGKTLHFAKGKGYYYS